MKWRLREYLAFLEREGYAPGTIRGRCYVLRRFEAARFDLDRFRDGMPESLMARHDQLLAVRAFLRWAEDARAETIALPPLPKSCPLRPPSPDDVRRLLRSVEGGTPVRVRDRAMFELIYSAGLRACEIRRLNLADVDLGAGVVTVVGKGGRMRRAPIGPSASAWIGTYLAGARPRLHPKGDELFVTWKGGPLAYTEVYAIVRRRAAGAETSARITPHALRRAAAAHCQAEGMNARALQELLGHADLKNLDRYTAFGLGELRRVMERFHPRGTMRVGRS